MDFNEIAKNVKKVKSSKTNEDFALLPYNFFVEMVENFSDVQVSKMRLDEEMTDIEDFKLELIQDGSISG